MRSATFVLQKDLGHQPGFAEWYSRQQEEMRRDPVLRWLVEARNQIEKQGDLDLRSTARVSVIAGWLPGPAKEMDVPPLWSPAMIAASLATIDLPKDVRDEGVLRVERRWVTGALPDWEILDACAYVWAVLNGVINGAERAFAGVEGEPVVGFQRLPCMLAGADARSATYHLAGESFVEAEMVPLAPTDEELREAGDRYGSGIRAAGQRENSLEGRVRWFHHVGRGMIEADGDHASIAFLFRDGKQVQMLRLDPEDQQAKYLLIDKLAQAVIGVGADEVVFAFEAWFASHVVDVSDPRHRLRAGERTDRGEAFSTTGINREGSVFSLHSTIERDGDRITLRDAEAVADFPIMLRPVFLAWGVEPPWQETVT